MNKLYFLCLLLLSMILSSCNDDGVDGNSEVPNVSTNYNFGNSVSRTIFGSVKDTSGNPVSGATVSIGSTSVLTNSRGFYVIKNASVKENFAFIKVKKTGFINGSRTLVPNNGESVANIMLIPATLTSTVASGASSVVSLANGTKVKFDGSFKDESGNAYSGNVSVSLFHLKPSDTYLNELMPGSLLATNLAGESRIMDTFGMLHVELTGSSGQKLNIATNHTAEITVAIDPLQASIAPATIPLWSFNEDTGIWEEDGVASKVGSNYVGTVKHFSWWNVDVQFPQAILHASVVNSVSLPVSNVVIELQRTGQIYGTTAVTNVNGEASGIIPANEILTLKIGNSCGTVAYTSTIGPFAQGSNNVLPVITLPASTVTTSTISGTLKNCSGSNVTNGVVILNNMNASPSVNYFANQSVLVSNGSFSFSVLDCGGSIPFALNGIDYANLQESGNISFTTSSNVNVGNIVACNSATEFITYQIDNQTPKLIVPPSIFNVYGSAISVYGTASPAAVSQFSLEGLSVGTTGITSSGYYIMFFDDANLPKNLQVGTTPGANISVNISATGPAGSYVDFTFSGTYLDGTTIRTISGTGHVKRDQ